MKNNDLKYSSILWVKSLHYDLKGEIMKKVKFLFLFVTGLLVLWLCGCEMFHVHKYQSVPGEIHHYFVCECGEVTDPEEHKFKWIVDKFASETETGLTHKECVDCGIIFNEDTVISIQDVEEVQSSWWINGENMQIGPPFFSYKIFVEKNKHNYEELIDIYVNEVQAQHIIHAINDGPFYIKLEESPYYEIVGQKEYLMENFETDDVLDFKFTIKATYPCDFPEWFVFKIKCDYNEEEVEKLVSEGSLYVRDCNFEDEYFCTIKDLAFINDSNGMIIGEFDDTIFYESLNRQYANGTISSKFEYMNKLYQFISNDKPFVNVEKNNTVIYESKNLKACLILGQEYDYLYDMYGQKEDNLNDIAKTAMGILYKNSIISFSVYESEIRYIEERGTTRRSVEFMYEQIAFDDFKWVNMPEYIYVQGENEATNKIENHCCEGNSAQLYLQNDKVAVGETMMNLMEF